MNLFKENRNRLIKASLTIYAMHIVQLFFLEQGINISVHKLNLI